MIYLGGPHIANKLAVWQGHEAAVGHTSEGLLIIPSIGHVFIKQPLSNSAPVLTLV
jgi:hypothetical protein